MRVERDFLQFDYNEDEREYDVSRYFTEDGSEPFDKHSVKQMLVMMNHIGNALHLDDYALKRLEVMLRTDLPLFAVNRRLILNWISKNFLL